MDTPQGNAAAGTLPLVIGVTGHRDLLPEDRPAYENAMGKFLHDLRRTYPNTPLQLISSLAEGADRMLARVALERGCELVAPLPFPIDEYERDFPDSVEEFRSLLRGAPQDNVFVLPLATGDSWDNLPAEGPDRNAQYTQVALYLASRSHILVALWDGDTTGKVGGTGEVVRLMAEGIPQTPGKGQSLLDPPDAGPVYHIHARRMGGQSRQPGMRPGRSRWLYPPQRGEEGHHRIFQYIESFNCDPARNRDPEHKTSKRYLIPDEGFLGGAEKRILNIYGYADSMAIHYQNVAHRALKAILILAGAMALAFEIYAHLLIERFVLALYPLFFIAITGLYFWHRKIGAHGKYLDYRALAEGLRVQLFWRLAGIGDSVAFSYLRKQNDDLEWIREALRTANVPPTDTAGTSLELVHAHWIKDQENYFIRCAHRQHARVEKLEQYSNWLYGAGLIVSIITIGLWDYLTHAHGLHHFLIVLMGFAPIVAALWISYGEKTGLHAQSKQYARFATIFTRARGIFDELIAKEKSEQRDRAIRHLLRELGKEALIENGDWVLLRRERPIEIPKG